jgi:hypothetical protein
MIKGGYAGKLLFINLTNGIIDARPLSEEIAAKFIGGYGLGARILYEIMKKGMDPLGPESVLGFVGGPLNATSAFFGGRYSVVCGGHYRVKEGKWPLAEAARPEYETLWTAYKLQKIFSKPLAGIKRP